MGGRKRNSEKKVNNYFNADVEFGNKRQHRSRYFFLSQLEVNEQYKILLGIEKEVNRM